MSATALELVSDAQALADFDAEMNRLRDLVDGVISKDHFGLYLWGAPGFGKSFHVRQWLRETDVPCRMFNSRMTAKGLFTVLKAAPDAIHLLEDVERLCDDRDAQGVLRSALWCQKDEERIVTWTTADKQDSFSFEGGIILIANRGLNALPEIQAIGDRIFVHHLEITEDQMAAQMRRVASFGFENRGKRLGPEKCLEVCAYIIDECRRAGCPLNLRLLDKGFGIFLRWDDARTRCHWRDHVASFVRQHTYHFRHEVNTLTREQRLDEDRRIVREILVETEERKEREHLWERRTGKKKSSFYARKREVEGGEFDT